MKTFYKLCGLLTLFSLHASGQTLDQITVDRYLDNEVRASGVTHRTWKEAYDNWKSAEKPETFEAYDSQKHQFIVLLYTVSTSVDRAYQAYMQRGVSAHFILDDTQIFKAVNPETDIAYYAGKSYFAGVNLLNYWSIGVDHVNPGFRDTYTEYPGFQKPVKLNGSSVFWYPFNESQFTNSMELQSYLQKKYKIPGYNVVTHADIAPTRKFDVGPMWDYKRAFTEFNVGFYPAETHQLDVTKFSQLSDDDYLQLITFLGYENTHDSIRAYQMHYSTGDISGALQESTKEDILKHVISLRGYVDPISHTQFEFFTKHFNEWRLANPEKAAAFDEYI